MRRVVPGALAVLLLLVSDAVAANGITPVSPQRGDTVPAGSRPVFKGRVRGRGPVYIHVCRSPRKDAEGLICTREAVAKARRRGTALLPPRTLLGPAGVLAQPAGRRTTGRPIASRASAGWATAGSKGRSSASASGRSRAMLPLHVGCSGWNYADWRGRFYPPGCPPAPLARPLRDAVRHRRGQLDLLPARAPRRRRALGRGHPARLRLRRQGQPLPHPHEAADRLGRGVERLYDGIAPLVGVAASSARCCGSSRSTSTATTTASRRARAAAAGPALRSSSATRAGSRPRSTASCARTARRSCSATTRAARSRPRAHRRLDVPALPLRPPRPPRQLLRDRAARVGGADLASCASARRCSPTSTTTGRRSPSANAPVGSGAEAQVLSAWSRRGVEQPGSSSGS